MRRFSPFAGLGFVLCTVMLLIPLVAFAAPVVKTVPYVPSQPTIGHPVWVTGFDPISNTCSSTKQITLKATTDSTATKYQWDFGDGSSTGLLNVTNRYNISATHSYCAAPGTIFSATVTVQDAGLQTTQKFYFVQVADKTLDVEASVAIDEGLWFLHTSLNRLNCGNPSVACGYWSPSYYSLTGMNAQAFFANGHTELAGDNDPYTDDVKRAMAFVFSGMYQRNILSRPTADGNGDGLGAYGSWNAYGYEQGMVLGSLMQSDNPNGIVPTGSLVGQTYKHVAQNMIDDEAYCQYNDPNNGGWRYSCLDYPDNSPNQWVAIGQLAAERAGTAWGEQAGQGLIVPQWVKDRNVQWLLRSQYAGGTTTTPNNCGMNGAYNGNGGGDLRNSPGINGGGAFSYQPYYGWQQVWGPFATTASGMVQQVWNNIGPSDVNFQRAMSFMRDNWDNPCGYNAGPIRTNYYYALLSFAKTMSLSNPPIATLHSYDNTAGFSDFDWYADGSKGVARALINAQNTSNGQWYGHDFSSDQYNYDTAFAILVLNKTVIQTGKPVAVGLAQPAYGVVGGTITLDGSNSFHQNPANHIVGWHWVIDKGGSATETKDGQFVTTTFTATGDYTAKLTVTDDATPPATADTTVVIHIALPPTAPTANAGGPYNFCSNVIPMFLDGSKSTNADDGKGEPGRPTDYITTYAWDLDNNGTLDVPNNIKPDVSGFFSGKPAGPYIVKLTVTDNTAAAYPSSGYTNLSSSATATVNMLGSCNCLTSLRANATYRQIQLTYSNVGADSYNIYRSVDNGATFTLLTNQVSANNPIVYLDKGLTTGQKYTYKVIPVKGGSEVSGCNVLTAYATSK